MVQNIISGIMSESNSYRTRCLRFIRCSDTLSDMYVIGHYESDMLSEIRQDFGHHVWCFPGQTVSDMLWDTEPDLGVSGNSHPQSSGLAMAGEQPTGAAPGPYLARVTPTGAASAIASAREATSTPPGRAHLSAVPGRGASCPLHSG